MKKLIVNADDFGLSEKINEGIVQAHLWGIVTSTSIMANGAAFEHAISICRSVGSLDVGIHLTLVEEKPILPGYRIPTLVNREGRFHDHAGRFIGRYLTGQVCLQEVREELEAQIRRVVNESVSISHIDSHQHIHMLPQILRISVELAQEYRIPAIRFPREIVRIEMLRGRGSVSRVLGMLILNLFCRLGRNAMAVRTDHFVGFFFGGNLHKKHLQKVLEQLPLNGTCELMCHPGLDDPNTRYGHWGYHWSDELNALLDQETVDIVRHKGIELISYRELTNL